MAKQTARALAALHLAGMDLRNPLPPLFPLTTIAGGSNLPRMKPPILSILLLAPALAFGQKFQDVTAKGAPVFLSVKHDYADMDPYAAVRNNSTKGILAMFAVVKTTDDQGRVLPCESRMDYAFKSAILAPQEERFACSMEASTPGAKVTQVVGAVLFVQFEDGSTWGNPDVAKEMLAARPQKLAFLKALVEVYYESGEDAFDAVLKEGMLKDPERAVAGCLVGDAKDAGIATIDLAKKRLAAAQQWEASGILLMSSSMH